MIFKIILSTLMLLSAFGTTLDVGKERKPITPMIVGVQWIMNIIVVLGLWLFV